MTPSARPPTCHCPRSYRSKLNANYGLTDDDQPFSFTSLKTLVLRGNADSDKGEGFMGRDTDGTMKYVYMKDFIKEAKGES